ncbi:MAG: hypothetical protein AB1445_01005 [Bacillota bacterium]
MRPLDGMPQRQSGASDEASCQLVNDAGLELDEGIHEEGQVGSLGLA